MCATPLTVVVAHRLEAEPFVAHYGLREDREHGLRCLVAPGITVLVTGMGHDACRDSITGLVAREPALLRGDWLNFGLAGHARVGVGELVAAASVQDGRKHWGVTTLAGLPVYDVYCVAQPIPSYEVAGSQDYVLDMESAGYCDALTSVARKRVVKLISDNLDRPFCDLDRARCHELVMAAKPALLDLLDR